MQTATTSTISTTSTTELPKGLRQVGQGEYLIQLSREGQRFTRRLHGNRQQALSALEAAKVELGKRLGGAPVIPSRGGSGSVVPLKHSRVAEFPTLAEFLGEGGRYGNHQLRKQSERTRRKLVAPIRYLLASDLGTMRLDAMATSDVNDYTEWRMKEGAMTFAVRKDGKPYTARTEKVSAPTINKSLRVLSSALHFAQREGLIAAVPRIELLPESDAKRVNAPSRDEYQRVLSVAEQLRPDAPYLPEVIELLGEFGVRPGEVFTMTWGSVAWDHGGNGKLRGGIWVEEQVRSGFVPKDKERRLVPMSPRGREVLEKLYARTPPPKQDDLVVPNANGLPFIRLDVPGLKGGGAGVWKKLQAVSRVSVTMYSLRHYFAQQNLSAGVPLHVVSKWMGHSKVELTSKRYGDYAPDHAEQWDWAGARATGERARLSTATSRM